MLSAKNLTYTYYGEDHPALCDFSFEFSRGRLYCIFGPNGSGKSTLLSLLCGELAADSGTVELDRQLLQSYTRRELARRLAVLEQDVPGKLPLLVQELVKLGRYPWKRPFELENDEDRRRVSAALIETGMDGHARRRYCHLSGGEKQRVMLARVLAQNTGLMLLDEPTSRLDIAHHLEFFKMAQSLARGGKCVITVCHDLYVAPLFADEVLLLCGGRLLAAGEGGAVLTPERLRQAYGCEIAVTHDKPGGVNIRI